MTGRSSWAILTCLLATALAAHQPPPTSQLADGHWTAWNPPQYGSEVQVYTVQTGDTLWGLAQRFLGDGHLWPQIWENNQYVLDAHWIYPGDPLLVPGLGAAPFGDPDGVYGAPLEEATVAESGEGGINEEEDPFGLKRFENDGNGGPVPVGFESDIYCSGYIGQDGEELPFQIAGSEYEFLNPTLDPQRNSELSGLWGKSDTRKYGLDLGDIVYIDAGKADGLGAGEMLTGVEAKEEVKHPLTGENLGRFYQQLGRIRVLSTQENTAIGEIVFSCLPMPVGTPLKLFEPEPVPLRRLTPMRPVNYPASNDSLELESGAIVLSEYGLVTLGPGNLVYIDRGDTHDATPGDIYTIYRRGRRGFPPIVIGELAVLSVKENASLARILRSRYAVYVGDALMLK